MLKSLGGGGSGAGSSPQGITNGVSNFQAQNTQKLRAGVARIRSGSGTMKVAVVGDSTTAGLDAVATNSLYPGAKILSTPTTLANILTGNGLPAQVDSIFGNQAVGTTAASVTAYDPRIALTNWAPDTTGTFPTLGAAAMTCTTSGGLYSFTPLSAFDTIDIYIIRQTSGGSFTVNVDGGATLQTISTAGANGYVKVTISSGITLGTHTINFTTTAATTTSIAGVAVRASTVARVEIYNMGYNGVTVNNYFTSFGSWNPRVALPVVAPDVTFINLTINDINGQPTTTAVYAANLQVAVTAAASGDVILCVGNPTSNVNQLNGVGAAYIAQVYAVAAANNLPVFDIVSRWISFAAANAVMPYFDTNNPSLHPGRVGYADIASGMSLFFQ